MKKIAISAFIVFLFSFSAPYAEAHPGSLTGSVQIAQSTGGATGSGGTRAQTPSVTDGVPTQKKVPKKPYPTKVVYKDTDMDKKKMFKVISVIDGDTILINIRGKNEKVRMLGIDAPEANKCYAQESTQKMRRMVQGKYVKLMDEKSQGNRDQYHRLLRYVYLGDGNFVNAEMVRQGFAQTFKKYPTRHRSEFNLFENQAKKEKLGMWNQCKL